MLDDHIRKILATSPQYAAITPVIEKEILHHDIMNVLVQQGVMQRLTFIGGTSLRMCYNSARLSEDLDFNAGHDLPRQKMHIDVCAIPSFDIEKRPLIAFAAQQGCRRIHLPR